MGILKNSKGCTFFLSLMTIAILFCCSVQVQAAQDGDFTYTVTASEAEITRYTGSGGAVTIPSTLGGFPVTKIGYRAFYGCTGLTSITIPQSVTNISDYSFADCTELTTVTISQGVISIGDFAFCNCTKLTTVTIPQGLTSIGIYAFGYCSSLANITIPEGVTNIGGAVFSHCTGLTSICIPQGVTCIGSCTFEECIRLTSITLPQGVTSIGDNAFLDCQQLTSITIPQEVTSIGSYAFRETGLKYINIPAGVTSIGIGAFFCSSITSISIPEGVTIINDQLFEKCWDLTSVTLPQGVTSIGMGAFYCCSKLTNIDIPQGVTSIGGAAFTDCHSLTSITLPQGIKTIGNYTFSECEGLTSFEIPEGVTSIGNFAFSHCSGLISIAIPQGVTSIGEGAFYSCAKLSDITFNSATTTIYDSSRTIPTATIIIGYDSSTAKNYALKYNRTFEKNALQSIAITTPANKLSYTVGDKLDIIGLVVTGTYIDGSTKVETITTANLSGFDSTCLATDQVLTITFRGKTATYKIQIVAGSSSISPATGSFDKNITVQADVITIMTLRGNTLLSIANDLVTLIADTDYTVSGNAITIKKSHLATLALGISTLTFNFSDRAQTFTITVSEQNQYGDYTYRVTDIKAEITGYTGAGGNITIPSTLGGLPVTSIGDKAFYENSTLTSITIPQGLTSIGISAFGSCTSLTNFIIPEGVTNIGSYAFGSCTGLKTITIPESITSIGKGIFIRCTGLTSITIPQGVTSIGAEAFAFSSLTNITIPQGVTSIGSFAFEGCSGLTSIIIPESVISIGDGAFYGCSELTNIAIPQEVAIIGQYTFLECTKLASITIPQGVKSIGYGAFKSSISLTSITFNSATTTIYDHTNTIPPTTKIIGYDSSTAKDYATKYFRTFEAIALQSIAITTPASKLSYAVGDELDITGLAVTGTYINGNTEVLAITYANISGFDSSSPANDQLLTITVSGKIVTYRIQVVAGSSTINPIIGNFNKDNSSWADVMTTMTLNGNTLLNLTNAGTPLTKDTDYSVNGSTVTINKAYLAQQPMGTTTLTFNFSAGASQTLSISVSDTTSSIIYGDVNDDGVVDNKDLVLFKRYFANVISSFNNPQAADVNGDGVIDNKDLVLVKRYFANVITVFTAQP